MKFDVPAYNQRAWDKNVDEGAEFTEPVDSATVEAARKGNYKIYLTPNRPVPQSWFPPLPALRVLCLGAGGGQHTPIMAAAGAHVTVFDLSQRQLDTDRQVAEREHLFIQTVLGDMSHLSSLPDEAYDLIIQPISNLYIPDLRPMWSDCFRILKSAGLLLTGFMNPLFYMFDRVMMDDQDILKVRHALPYSDLNSLSQEELQHLMDAGWPMEFGHTLEEQIGGQIEAGFTISGFYEDRDPRCILDNYTPVYMATRAEKGQS